MKVTCPTDHKHDRFSVTAHVTQLWEVDNDGDFVECVSDCVDVTHRPDKDDLWLCTICGAEAIVENDN